MYMFPLLKSKLVNLRYIEGNGEERAFFREMSMVEDIGRYYGFNAVPASQLDKCFDNLAAANSSGTGVNFIIERQDSTRVGLISAVPEMYGTMMRAWDVGYAVAPAYRRKGYAHDALTCLISVLRRSNIQYIILDISEDNKSSEQLAIMCGFEKMRGKEHLFDKRNPDFGYHNYWIRDLHVMSKRDRLIEEATESHHLRNYRRAIALYEQALLEPEEAGSLYEEGMVYSNLGMSYSSAGMYQKAYDCLRKAWSLGVRNATVQKEFDWLKRNAGIG